MSHGEQRLRQIAIGAAVLALLVAVLAVLVVARRGGSPRAAAVASRRVRATYLARLSSSTVVQGAAGVRVEPTVAEALGLSDGDTLLAISGRAVTRSADLGTVLDALDALHPSAWFVELGRDGDRVIERWEIDGDLAAARRAMPLDLAAGAGAGASAGAGSDPLIATVTRIDARTYAVPHATVEAWLADPARVIAGVGAARHVTNPDGPDGFELQALRPGSVAAGLGFQDGDVIRAINGGALSSLDAIAPLIVRGGRQISVDVQRHGAAIILNYSIR
jgi:type II secretory pathway component PulC